MLSLNSSSVPNGSNESMLGEFTHWKATVTFVLTSKAFVLAPLTLFINLSLFVAIWKSKKLRRPLNLIHQCLLLLNSLILVPDVVTTFVFVPPALRSCDCNQSASFVHFLVELLYIVFQPFNYACIGVFQLLIIKGKSRLVSYKSVSGAILFCIGITTVFLSEGLVVINFANQTYFCNGICPQASQRRFAGITYVQGSYTAFSLLPSLMVVTVSTTWSCIVFKKQFIGNNEYLSRRIISLPIVLPLTLVLPSFLSVSLLVGVEEVLTVWGVEDLTYWILFNRIMLFQVHEVISGILYPCILLCLHPRIGNEWKRLLFGRCKKDNQVFPDSGTS